jgi:DNA-binding transcriptional MerR regulator
VAALDKAPEAFRIISEVAEDLDVPQHVLRFWESRFAQIRPMKRGGGRRYYRPDDVDLLRGIRHLLYGEGYTIRGVQRILREQGVSFVQTVWQEGAPQPPPDALSAADDGDGEPAERVGILGRLPGLFRAADAEEEATFERREPTMTAQSPVDHDRPDVSRAIETRAPDESQSLSRGHVRQLDAALHQLIECRRKLGEALEDR